MRINTRYIAYAAVIAVLYAAVTLLFAPISYGAVQFRISEALMMLAAFTPAAIPGLYTGCVIANLLGGFGIIDILFGGLATFMAALVTYMIARKTLDSKRQLLRLFLLPLPTVFFNALIVGGYLPFVITMPGMDGAGFLTLMAVSVLSVGLGEIVVTYAVGLPIYQALRRTNIFGNDGKRDMSFGDTHEK
ncbi:MAG: QueT transporter family protein [Eubacteriales bacterium]|jgi:uncharacterized membrane protein|nr:QueT transporter family protein [Eubacteriales bacterium]MDD4327150.1 QueT transporter family protein [Eubacteriales bacterium]MDD4716804.1 QueT transporter family protein [Eubacteriales bacterium]